MKKRSTRKLKITVETLRALSPRQLAAANGGTVIITVTDPITAPPTNRATVGCPARQTELTCGCIG